ncbi:uncharacterized protein LOC135119872 isoform X3 [Zophobas morio]|uniref:uncharacterized protein LOC135119872 isoform X3 n=1 Tax=Zophobas morio TaxID=2755281 RepID=UPI003082B7CB
MDGSIYENMWILGRFSHVRVAQYGLRSLWHMLRALSYAVQYFFLGHVAWKSRRESKWSSVDKYLQKMLDFTKIIAPPSLSFDRPLREFFIETRKKFHANPNNNSRPRSLLSKLGNALMIGLIGWFAISCMERLAQQHAAEDNAMQNRKNGATKKVY